MSFTIDQLATIENLTQDHIDEIFHQLDPCPFCGKKEEGGIQTLWYGRYQSRHFIKCIPCAIVMYDDRADKVITTWNTRGGVHPLKRKTS
jgi:restriction alleviation protein Lar